MNQTLLLNITMMDTQKAQRVVGKWTIFVFTSNKPPWLLTGAEEQDGGGGGGREVVSGSCQTFCCYSWIFVGSGKFILWPCCE